MPSEWGNIVREGRDGYLRFDYSMTTPILWSALQHALNKIDKLEIDINKLKKDNKDSDNDTTQSPRVLRETSPKAKAKAKSKSKK